MKHIMAHMDVERSETYISFFIRKLKFGISLNETYNGFIWELFNGK